MAKSYIYTGKKTANIPPILPSNYIFENYTFIINYSKALEKKKSKGCVALYNFDEGQILDFHLDCIYKVCKNPQIILITGIGADKICKHNRRSEYTIVENKFYAHFNNAQDIKLGLNAALYNNIFWIDGRTVPNINTYKIMNIPKNSLCLTYEGKVDDNNIGIVKNDFNIISKFIYDSRKKVKGIYYFSPQDSCRLKNKMGQEMPKNYLDYELFSDIQIKPIEDTTESIFINENWTH